MENILAALASTTEPPGTLALQVVQEENLQLELVCCKKWQKKCPNQETGLGNMGRLEALIDTKLILND